MTFIRILCVSLLAWLAGIVPAQAQQQQAARPLDPVFHSFLGNVEGGQALPASFVKGLLDSALVARDSAGHPHAVVAFNFGYATTDTYENDTTGRPVSTRSYLSFHFKGNRLDSVWRKGIAEKLRSGDVLYFDRVIAEGGQGVQYLSSPLTYRVR